MFRTATAILFLLAASAAAEEKPNIVIILTDDQGYGDVGAFGCKDIRTPHIDSLAKNGMKWTDFYVAQAVCTASRAALMSGCYPNRIGMHGALNHDSNTGIAATERLLPEILRDAGYETACFGKWHLGHRKPFLPTNRGFQRFEGIPYSNDNGPLHPTMKGLPPLPWYHGDKVVATDPPQEEFTKRLTKSSCGFIREAKGPFFLYLAHIMPHVPIHASAEFKGKSQRGLYGDVIEELDASVGEVLKAIKEKGVERDTLVIFFSDNGPFLSYGNHAGSAGKFREGKLTSFDGGVRTPCLMRWPAVIPVGSVQKEPAMTIDLLPTICGILKKPLPALPIDGLDIAPMMRNPEAKTPHESLAFYSGEELQAVRMGNFKLHFPHDYLTSAKPPGRDGKPANFANMKPLGMDVSGIQGIASRHGYVVERTKIALFNLEKDPEERTNLVEQVAKDRPDLLIQLQNCANGFTNTLGNSGTKQKGTGVRPVGRAAE